MNLGDAVLKLTTDNTDLEKGLGSAKIKTSDFTDVVKKLVAAYLSFESLQKVIGFLKDSVAEYLKSEEALTRMNSALRATDGYSSASSKALSDLADSLMTTTKFEHEASQEALALMMSLGGMTAKMASEALPTLQDFAAGMGIDLQAAATIFSKAMEGNVGALGRYGIKVEEGLKGQELFTAIMGQMSDKFGGLARAMGDTASGSLTKLNNAFGEMREELGRSIVTEMKGFVDWLTTVAGKIGGVMKAANDLRDALAAQGKGVANISDELVIASAAYDNVRKKVDELNGGFMTGFRLQELQWEAQQKGYETLTDYSKALEASLTPLRMRREGLEGAAAREKAYADSLAAAAKAAADYADEVSAAYAKTSEGQREALEAAIAGWEGHLAVAGASKDKVVAILNDLYEQYASKFPDALGKTAQALSDMAARWQAMGKAFQAAEWEQGIRDMNARWEETGEVLGNVVEAAEAIAEPTQAALLAVNQAVGKAMQDAADASEQAAADSADAWQQSLDDIKTFASFVGDAFSKIQDIVRQFYENQNALIDNALQTELNALGEKYKTEKTAIEKIMKAGEAKHLADEKAIEDSTLSEADKTAALKKLDEDYFAALTKLDTDFEAAKLQAEKDAQKEKNRIALEMFRANKALSLIDIAIGTAQAIVQTFAQLGFTPWGALAAGLMTAMGVAQAALVSSQPEPVFPALARGGEFTVPPGYENDSFPMRVQSGEHVSVTPAGEGGGGEMIHNTLVLDGSVIGDWITKASRNKRFLITARSVVP